MKPYVNDFIKIFCAIVFGSVVTYFYLVVYSVSSSNDMNNGFIEKDIIFSKNSTHPVPLDSKISDRIVGQPPIILGWTSFFGQKLMDTCLRGLWSNAFNQSTCPYRCTYTDNRTLIQNATIVLFHVRNLDHKELPPNNPDQLNVFFLSESPLYTQDKHTFVRPNFFNVTMTYRTDSDIFVPYGSFQSIVPGVTQPEEIWTKEQVHEKVMRKTELAVQFVSNCHTPSHRENFTELLQNYMNITKFGACFDRYCLGDKCLEDNLEKHFFYLAFENSICRQYVTEKFWNIKHLVVPVVLSRMPFQGLDIPPNSFISADDFPDAKQLAERLIYLQKNPEEYIKYFDWTKSYKKTQSMNPLCELCKWAVERRRKTIDNIVDWTGAVFGIGSDGSLKIDSEYG
ncbi:glycosyltransferase family 10 (fucosyltransferase) c-term domain-containing protein [Ditylenchus destructor]|nr:glycosyltransferase family 10 (fucosyltransferase) c-term domain-containing protein [Ditylenchus destructor]